MAIKFLDDTDVSGISRTVLEDTPAAGGTRTGLILAFPTSPYGLVFRSYASGQSSIQNQRESNDGELYPLFLNPLGGNVGIGTDNPLQKLQVDGSLRVTGAYYDSNNSPGTSGQVLSSTATGTDWITNSGGSSLWTDDGTNGISYSVANKGVGIGQVSVNGTALSVTGLARFASTTRFDSTIRFNSEVLAGTSAGTTGQVLTSNGAGNTTSWTTPSSGGTIGGTAANTRIAYGSGVDTITSDADFTIVTTATEKRIKSNGGIQVANMTAAATSSNVGSIRYRTAVAGLTGVSYVDMVMQTGSATYEWVNIVQNSWSS